MFESINPFSSFSISNSEESKLFYADILGLKVSEESMPTGERMLTLNLDGGGKVLMYPKPDHKPATFTVLNLPVKEIHSAVKELKDKGVEFIHYDGNDEEEINHNDGPLIAWFKDPSGNFLSVMEQHQEFTTTRFFAAPIEKLFLYWTDKNLLEQWNYPDGMNLRVPKFEAKVGGSYRYEHFNDEGVYVCTGEIKEFIPNKKLVMVDQVQGPDGKMLFKDLELVIEFKDATEGCEMTATQRGFDDPEALDQCKVGWEQSMNRLQQLLRQ